MPQGITVGAAPRRLDGSEHGKSRPIRLGGVHGTNLVSARGVRRVASLLMALAFVLAAGVVQTMPRDTASPPENLDDAVVAAEQAGRALASRAARSLLLVPRPVEPAGWSERKRITTRAGRVIVVPNGCGSVQRDYDVVVHFHGAVKTVEKSYDQAGLEAVLLVVNLGLGSGPYENQFAGRGALERQLDALETMLERHCGTEARPQRVALSAWSAGYGAVLRILRQDSSAERVDAILLSDGLHVGFEPKGARKIRSLYLDPMTRYAELAVQGERLFAITHSDIRTVRYASTTETADFLLASQEVGRSKSTDAPPRPSMRPRTAATQGSFHVLGFDGRTPDDHADHLYTLGQTTFPLLASRWQ